MLRLFARRKKALVGNASFFDWGRTSSSIKPQKDWQQRSWSSVRVSYLFICSVINYGRLKRHHHDVKTRERQDCSDLELRRLSCAAGIGSGCKIISRWWTKGIKLF